MPKNPGESAINPTSVHYLNVLKLVFAVSFAKAEKKRVTVHK